MTNQENPYAAPQTDPFLEGAEVSSAEAIRKEHIKHEASVKSIGLLYAIGAFFLLLGGAGLFVLFFLTAAGQAGGAEPDGVSFVFTLILSCFYVGLGVLQGFMASGLRKLKPWARWAAVVFSVLGLIGFPIGTLISAYFLYLLLSEKGTMVFSPEYKDIIAQTPHIKYQTSRVLLVVLILFLVLFLTLIAALLIGI